MKRFGLSQISCFLILNSTIIYFLYEKGKKESPYLEDMIMSSNSFQYLSSDFAYTSYNKYPRCVGEIDGDGMDDIIGFEDDGVYVSFS